MSSYITSTMGAVGSFAGYYMGGLSGAFAGAQLGSAAGMEIARRTTGTANSTFAKVAQNCLLTGGLLTSSLVLISTGGTAAIACGCAVGTGTLIHLGNKIVHLGNGILGNAPQAAAGRQDLLDDAPQIPDELHDQQDEPQEADPLVQNPADKQPSAWEKFKSGLSTIGASIGVLKTSTAVAKSAAVASGSVLAVGGSLAIATSIFGEEATKETTDGLIDGSTDLAGSASKKIGETSIEAFSSVFSDVRDELRDTAEPYIPKVPIVEGVIRRRADALIDEVNEDNAAGSFDRSVDATSNGLNKGLKAATHFSIEKSGSSIQWVKNRFN